MCICFLLMTAVWTQLGSVQVKQSNGTEAAPTTAEKTVDVEMKFAGSNEAVVTMKKSGKVSKTVKVTGGDVSEISKQLNFQLQNFRLDLTREGLKVGSVFLTAHENVDYGSMVAIMDVFRKNEMSNIGVVYASR
jgi:biopolymer transport protein ExbD